ncbi:Amino-acid permease 2 [Golovinomyces cichoracearum]|uniref:Amino-acid permease 2 n=1 Tax=Golovinomyces cichoracearum TaxID=62708 RepID=A0A420IZ49_9PEZI|nr:Amino-acid permease 2 [Golovinomyces cichoracearum]
MADVETVGFSNNEEDRALEHLGYKPQLKRSFGPWGMIGFSFSIVTCWSALGGVLVTGVNAGGPPVMIWGWVGVSIFSLCVAYSMAEMCSEYPVAGGQYSWVYLLSARSARQQLSYLTGWFMIIGILAMGATNSFIGANFLLGQANLLNSSYVIQRWHTVLMAYLITLFAAFINMWGAMILDRLSKGLLIFNVTAFVAVVTTILVCNTHKQPASFVFRDFQNFTGSSNPIADDAPAHMCEELKDASKQAPRAMVMSVYIGAITGFIFLISVCFCIGNIEAVANTSTMVPLIQIFFDSTGSKIVSCILSSAIFVIILGASNALLAEGARSIYAFARDGGLPFSSYISRVERKRQTPVTAIILGAVVQMIFNSIYLGTVTGFNTVIAIATEGFYLSYAMPLFVRIASYFNGNYKQMKGPWAMKPHISIAVNAAGLLYLLFASVTFNFPSLYPVTSENMNYTSAAIGIMMIIALITWFASAESIFSGPNVDIKENTNINNLDSDELSDRGDKMNKF